MKMRFVGREDGTIDSAIELNGLERVLVLGKGTVEGHKRVLAVQDSPGHDTAIEIQAEPSSAEIEADRNMKAAMERVRQHRQSAKAGKVVAK